jgi:hypothetical protein
MSQMSQMVRLRIGHPQISQIPQIGWLRIGHPYFWFLQSGF